jgi:hypothetical protein
MKVAYFEEYDGCFSVGFEPETIEETAKLIRFKANATKDLRGIYFNAYKTHKIQASLVIGKRKRQTSSIRGQG